MNTQVLSLPACSSFISTQSWDYCIGNYKWSNGSNYYGEFRNGQRNGQGTMTYSDGSSYVGQWGNDTLNGFGTYTFSYGKKYIGNFFNGDLHGQGTYLWPDGMKYSGEWQFDKRDGFGVLYFADGRKYSGDWFNDNRQGKGTFEWPNGDKYVGDWLNDKRNGYGKLTFANGHVQEGIWKDDEFENIEIYINGQKYKGDLKNGKPNGKGTLTDDEGNKYAGEFKNGELHGKGTFFSIDGESVEGQFKNDEPYGQFTMYLKDGTIISADAKDKFQFGTVIYPNGNKYTGELDDGIRDGKGRMTFANGVIKEGIWKEGEFQYATNDSTPKSSNSNLDDLIPAASGSGFAINNDGYVVTNYHVIEGCNNVEIIDKGQTIPATVVSFDVKNDIALLKSNFKPFHAFSFSKKNPYPLMDIYVAGYPFGYDISTQIKITQGVVSSLAGVGNNFSQIQITAAVQPGNSGGPIVDENGNVVGIVVSKLDAKKVMENYGVVPEGTNFGVKSNVILNFLESNKIKLVGASATELSKQDLSQIITDGTYYISCLMTMAQIGHMKERKAMFIQPQ
jgi:hypothetical protein